MKKLFLSLITLSISIQLNAANNDLHKKILDHPLLKSIGDEKISERNKYNNPDALEKILHKYINLTHPRFPFHNDFPNDFPNLIEEIKEILKSAINELSENDITLEKLEKLKNEINLIKDILESIISDWEIKQHRIGVFDHWFALYKKNVSVMINKAYQAYNKCIKEYNTKTIAAVNHALASQKESFIDALKALVIQYAYLEEIS